MKSSPLVRALLALAAVLALGCVCNANGAFFRLGTHLSVLDTAGVRGMVAIGECLVILGAGIDLSVGAVLGLCGMVFAGLMLRAGWSVLPAALVAMAVAGVFGLINGVLVARARVQPFLATLATMVIARGFARYVPELAGMPANSKFTPTDSFGPPSWQWLQGRIVADIPTSGALFLLVTALTVGLLHCTVFGRHLRAVGGNLEAARLSGIATARVQICSYVLCSLFTCLGAICWVARDLQGNPYAGDQFELNAIAAVVIGGCSLLGGRGGAGLAAIGVFTLWYIDKVLSLNVVPEHWRYVIQGGIILAAVLLQERRR